MKEQTAQQYEIKGKELVCPVCGEKKFLTRSSLLNTPGLSFLNFDFANKQADNYICNNCGYIMWFFPERYRKD